MQSIPDAALGAIVAAFITGVVALLGLIISKENKTSEFREAWIDALRAEIAALVGHLNGIEGTLRRGLPPNDAWVEARDDVVALNRCVASIRLRLNPQEMLSRQIDDCLKEIERIFQPAELVKTEEYYAVERKLLTASQTLLKSEWRRVREGEFVFRSVKLGSLALSVGAIIVFSYYLLRPHKAPENIRTVTPGIVIAPAPLPAPAKP